MISILLAACGYSLLNICQATQKIGMLRIRENRFQGTFLWIIATVGTLVSSVLVFAAVALGTASLVGAMAGIGLAALALFSHFVMKERIGLKEIIGIVIIVLGAGIIGFFSNTVPPSLIHLDYLFVSLAVAIVLSCIPWLILRTKPGIVGIIIGIFSGSLGGFVPLFQKVSTSDIGKSLSLFPVSSENRGNIIQMLLAMFSNPFTLMWILLSLASMLILQFAYKKAEVIRIIPFFSSTCIIVPVLGGVLCLEEKLHPLQWIGVVLILGGLVVLTVKGRRKQNPQ